MSSKQMTSDEYLTLNFSGSHSAIDLLKAILTYFALIKIYDLDEVPLFLS